MQLIPMHPSLRCAFEHYCAGNNLTRISTDKLSHTEDLLTNILANNLILGKTTIIITEDAQDPAWMAKVLSSYGLSQYCFVWTNEYLSQQNPIERIRSFSHEKGLGFDQDFFRVLRNEREDMFSIITQKYALLSKKVMGHHTWKDLLHLKCRSDYDNNQELNLSLTDKCNENDFNIYLSEIGRAESGFQEKFLLLNNFNLFHSDLYKDEFDLETVVDELSAMHDEINELYSLYSNKYNKLKSEIRAEIDREYIILSNLSNKLSPNLNRLEKRSVENKSGKLIVQELCTSREYQTIDDLLSDIENLICDSKYLSVELITKKRNKWSLDDFRYVVKMIEEETNNFQKSIKEKLEYQLRRIGPYNIDEDGLHQLEAKLNDYIQSLNNANIFNKSFSNNALSFDNKIELITDIKADLQRGIIFLETFTDYHEWRASLDPANEELILEKLSMTPYQWKDVTKENLINEYLSDSYDPQLSSIQEDIQSLNELDNLLYNLKLDKIHWLCNDQRASHVQNLKSSDAYLYQKLFNSHEPNITNIAELFITHNLLFNSFFPIVITTEKNYKELKVKPDAKWNSLISLNVNLEDSLIENSDLMVKISEADYEQKSTDNNLFRHSVNRLGTVRTLRNIPIIERHDEALKLAEVLMDTVDYASVYQMRNVSIISSLSEEIEDIVCAQFIPQGIKCIHRRISDPVSVLEGLISTDSEIYFLHENGGLNPLDTTGNCSPEIMWHQYILSCLNEAGIHTLSVDSAPLYLDRQLLLKTIRQTILAPLSKENTFKEGTYAEIA